MKRFPNKLFRPVILFILITKVNITCSIDWSRIRCSSDADHTLSDGTVADIGRFPWLGIIQHTFSIGGISRFAVTTGLLIHPGYVIAPAEDIAKIQPDQLSNNTKFIAWYSASLKYVIDIRDYILHPEYTEKRTFATIALLELITYGETGVGGNPKSVLPICMPLKGAGTFEDIYAAKMSDESKDIQKEIYKMKFVETRNCEEFYKKKQLDYKMMTPSFPTCALVEQPMPPCVWDGGVALITKQSWGHWTLLGFSVRGPGCGAPTRFLALYDYLPWINDIITPQPSDQDSTLTRLAVRQLSPIKLLIYPAKQLMPKGIGQCDRMMRGNVQYKDSFEVTMTKNQGQGFFFVSVAQIASFTCAEVVMEDFTARSNTAIWIEHYCHREIMGAAPDQDRPRDYRKNQCFLYFKSTAFVEFRFFFSFKAHIEMTLYGFAQSQRRQAYPFINVETTEKWWPTNDLIRWTTFQGFKWWWQNI